MVVGAAAAAAAARPSCAVVSSGRGASPTWMIAAVQACYQLGPWRAEMVYVFTVRARTRRSSSAAWATEAESKC